MTMTDATIREFNRRFWLCRDVTAGGEGVSLDDPTYQALGALARSGGIAGGEILAECCWLDFQADPERLLRRLDALPDDWPDGLRGLRHYLEGQAAFDLSQFSLAEAAYRRALTDPKLGRPARAWQMLGLTLGNLGRHSAAVAAFRKALADPSLDDAGSVWYLIAVTWRFAGQPRRGLKALRESARYVSRRDSGDLYREAGLCRHALGELARARAALKRALLDPKLSDPAETLVDLAIVCLESGRPRRALGCLRRSIAARAADAAAFPSGSTHYYLGLALLELEEAERAVRAFRKATRLPLTRPIPSPWPRLAEAYERLGRSDLADRARRRDAGEVRADADAADEGDDHATDAREPGHDGP